MKTLIVVTSIIVFVGFVVFTNNYLFKFFN